MDYLRILRPSHWIKNIFVFAALVFGKKFIGSADEVFSAVTRCIGAFACFCLAASAIYIVNDIIDRGVDRLHRDKSKRPIAAGTVSVSGAIVISVIAGLASFIGAWFIGQLFAIIILVYIVLMHLYSFLLKRVMILDCLVISVGFCLRAIAGAVVLNVFISPWLVICTFSLCLFLAFSKRRTETVFLGQDSESFRQTLAGYTPELLAHMVDVTSGLAIVTFLLYTMDERTRVIFGSNNLVYTTPLVLYCVFRFSALVQKGRYSGLVQIITCDMPFQIGVLAWVVACVVIIYFQNAGCGCI